MLQNLEYHGVMRFLFQDSGAKLATKCIRVASTSNTEDVIETLVEKFRPDMKMLTTPIYHLYEVDSNGGKTTSVLWHLGFGVSVWFGAVCMKGTEQLSTNILIENSCTGAIFILFKTIKVVGNHFIIILINTVVSSESVHYVALMVTIIIV